MAAFQLATAGIKVLLLTRAFRYTAEEIAKQAGWRRNVGEYNDAVRALAAAVLALAAATLLTAGASNALYTLGGIVLMLATPDLPPWIRAAMWLTWLAGFLMTAAAIADHVAGMGMSTAVLFPLLIAWIAWMGARWRQT